jgi:hypothetical protein
LIKLKLRLKNKKKRMESIQMCPKDLEKLNQTLILSNRYKLKVEKEN